MNILNQKSKIKKNKKYWLMRKKMDFLKEDKKILMDLKEKMFVIEKMTQGKFWLLNKCSKDCQYHLHKLK